MTGPRPFRSKVFLFRLLAVIFCFQALVIVRAMEGCMVLVQRNEEVHSIKESCPDLGQKAENLFNIAVATVLSLLSTKDNRI